MDARQIIAKLRDAAEPDADELRWFAAGLATGAVSDAQAGAFAMAALINGLGEEGRVALTLAMRDSGNVMRWDGPGPVVDKHSTGGIGDCTSLVLAPALAACGVTVPMISGRGLGHTGGTLDKLEAIQGLSTQFPEAAFRRIVRDVGCAIVGATDQIAPADRRLYQIRDVTATVGSIDLITASILSKKLAAGLERLVLDVKAGSGAFMKTPDAARALAEALVRTANGAGCPTQALVTDMNEPLAPALGNALEIAVVMAVLEDGRNAAPRLFDVTVALGETLLTLAGRDASEFETAVTSGRAMERFAAMIASQGGPPDMDKDWRTHLPKAPVIRVITARQTGYVTQIDGEALGQIVVSLGGGRQVETDTVDPAVGLSDLLPLGTQVAAGDPICTLHARDNAAADRAEANLQRAISIGPRPAPTPLIIERIAAP